MQNVAVIPTKVGIHDKSARPSAHMSVLGGVVSVLALTFIATPAHAAGLFGRVELKGDNISSFTKWVDVLSRIRHESGILHACENNPDDCPTSGARRWREMMDAAKEMSPAQQMRTVNRFFNGFPYIEDIDNYGKSDYWATPLQFLKKSGDCEDYAIAKFVSLRMLGWANASLRVVILRDTVRDEPHAILAAKLDGHDMILDNLASQPLPSETVIQYSPYYAVNETTRWIFIKPEQ
jgi:predicted transglutaminase-like cysteine proteinase